MLPSDRERTVRPHSGLFCGSSEGRGGDEGAERHTDWVPAPPTHHSPVRCVVYHPMLQMGNKPSRQRGVLHMDVGRKGGF